MSITVANQTYTPMKISDIEDPDGKIINNYSQLYDLLESILLELVDNIFRISLRDLYMYKYVNIGGKSINEFINTKYLSKSFDFDLHLYEGDENYINVFGLHLANNLNKTITTIFPLYRPYILNILRRYELITKKEESHYLQNNLFYYGKREKTNFSIKGIFIDFLFRDDLLLGPNKYSNEKITNPKHNRLFYPIADIDLEADLNFGLQIVDDRFFYNGYDNIKYANYVVTIHNLVKYASLPGIKQPKNLNKLSQFAHIDKYTCSSLDRYNNQFETDLNSLPITTYLNIPQNNNLNMVINGQNIFTNGMPMRDIINIFIQEYNTGRVGSIQKCVDDLILDPMRPNKNKIFINGVSDAEQNIILSLVERKLYEIDSERYILAYSGGGYIPIGLVCDYNHFELFTINTSSLNVIFVNKKITLSDGSDVIINNDKTFSDRIAINKIINKISNNIVTIKNSQIYLAAVKNLVDEFYVFRIQNFMCINSPNGDQFNLSVLKTDSLLFMPRFLSASFSTNFENSFTKTNSFLLRIKIKASSQNWIFLNKYSSYPNESEILINRNCFFVVTGIDNLPIRLMNGSLRDITVINLQLCDSLIEALSLVGADVAIINVHDKYLENMIYNNNNHDNNLANRRNDSSNRRNDSDNRRNDSDNITNQSKNIFLTNNNQNVPNDISSLEQKTLINKNTLLFTIEPITLSDTLIDDAQIYHNLLQAISDPKSISFSTSNKADTKFHIGSVSRKDTKTQSLTPQTKISQISLPTIIPQPNTYNIHNSTNIPAAAVGGSKTDNYYKYMKYKSKYYKTKSK